VGNGGGCDHSISMSGTSFRGTLAIARATSMVMSKHHSAIIGSATIASILAFAPR